MTEAAGAISSGLNALMLQLETVSNNIANANTVGFKRRVTSFHSELHKQMQALQDGRSASGIDIQPEQTMDYSPGTLVRTDNPLDVGLDGCGYMVLQTPGGPLYTRNGSLQINHLGQLTDAVGRLIGGQNGPIVIPPTVGRSQIHIADDGTISAQGATLGKIKLADFGEQENLLVPVGMGAFDAPQDVKPQDPQSLRVRQGYQESSNVKVIQELINLMSLSRLYENNMNIMHRKRENSQAMLGVANS